MAIANADGSIILSTKVDTSGMEQGTKSLKNQAAKLAAEYRKAGMSQSEAFKKAWSEIERTRKETDSATKSTENFGKQSQESGKQAKGAFDGLKATLQSVAGYLALAFSVTKIIQFSNEAGQLATQTEASVQRLVDIYGSASDSVGDFIDANARALGMSKAAAASFSSVYGNLFSVWADQATNAELTNRYLNMTAVVASKTGRTVEDVQERVRSGLLGNTEAIEDLGIFVNVKTIEMTNAFQRMANGKSWEQLDAYTQQQIRSMAILEQATAKYGDEVADTSATIRNQFNAAYQDFQNTLGNIVNTILLPVLQVLTQIFNIATTGLNVLTGKSGQILENAEIISSASNKTVENINAQAEAQEELNKEMKKTLAGFDDIQILSSQTAENTSSASSGGLQGIGGDLGGTAPDGSAYVEEIDATLTAIMGIVALSLVAVGLILLFTGNIGWGIGFIIAGVATLTVTMASASEFGYDGIINMLTTIMGIAGGALLALGIILLWIGGVVGKPVAIGMIIAGGALIVSAVVAKAAFSPNDVGGWLSIIMGIAGGALLAIGIILCMVGSTPLGVGMIIAGSVALVSAVALNFDVVKDQITGWVAVIMGIVGAAALVLGIVLTASGTHLALGIALIAAGAASLVAVTALNWNAIVEALQGPIGVITAIVSGALLVLGIILVATGVGIPLGIALIAAGAVGLVTVTALNRNAIVEWIKGAWEAVKRFWNKYIAPVFTLKWWTNLAIKCGNGLIAGFEGAINGIIWLFETMINWIVDGLNKISFDVPDWVPGIGGKTFGFNLDRVDFGEVSFGRIPELARGAVIPPNREFLAVLGDQKQGVNIEAPLQTIVDAFNIALAQNGNAGGGNTEVVLELDGREFGRAVVEQGNQENRRIGTRLVIA